MWQFGVDAVLRWVGGVGPSSWVTAREWGMCQAQHQAGKPVSYYAAGRTAGVWPSVADCPPVKEEGKEIIHMHPKRRFQPDEDQLDNAVSSNIIRTKSHRTIREETCCCIVQYFKFS